MATTRQPDPAAPTFTLRADSPRHLQALVAALHWAQQQFGPRDAFTQQIGAAVREFDVYEETKGRVRARPALDGPSWPRF